MKALLVTGARSLATREGAVRWARGLIREALEGADLLIVGDAPGPDAWARDAGASIDRPAHIYCTRGQQAGRIWIAGDPDFNRWATIAPPSIDAAHWEWSRWLKRRNAAMVRDARGLWERGHDVRVLALLDGLKADAPGRRVTRGTEHTAGLAERAGLDVRREVWRG